uniref:S-locus glycoprotein domain-containing protein n=1 Tax=Fagus sylvatica TaxID=28930 RepID=A0A2N9IG32_FAGSY
MEQSISKKSWCRFALLLLIIMSLKVHLSTASDTLYPGQRGWIRDWGVSVCYPNHCFLCYPFIPYAYVIVMRLTRVSDAVERWTLSDMMMRRSRAKRHHDFLLMLCSMLCLFVLNATGELNLYVWKEDLRQWNLVWKAPPQPCEIFGFCGVWGICNQQKIGTCMIIQEGVRQEIPYDALTRSSRFPTAFQGSNYPRSDEVEADTKWCDGAVGKSSLTASSSHGRFDNVMKTSVEHTCTREIDECPRFDLVLRKIS